MGLWIVKVEAGETPKWKVDVVVLASSERGAKQSATRRMHKTFPDARSVSATEVDIYGDPIVYVHAEVARKEAAVAG